MCVIMNKFKLFKKYVWFHYKMGDEEKIDYLEVDDPIPGQSFVCLSFVSPEDLIESKEAFKVAKFLQSVCKDKDIDFKRTLEQYKDFTYKFQDDLQKDFDEQNNFKTNVRGIKVRGVYQTKEEATRRAKKLQTLDSDFSVFVGQVGYWLPWDPCADKIEDEVFMNSQLNDMMEKYKENNINKDLFYEEQKREKVKAAREEVLRKKKEEAAKKTLEDVSSESKEENLLEDTPADVKDENDPEVEDIEDVVKETEKVVDDVEKVIDDVKEVVKDVKETVKDAEEVVEDVKETVEEAEKTVEENVQEAVEDVKEAVKGGETVDEDLKQSLESVDPWMANKLKDSKDECSQ